jgi:hypothetical protein
LNVTAVASASCYVGNTARITCVHGYLDTIIARFRKPVSFLKNLVPGSSSARRCLSAPVTRITDEVAESQPRPGAGA